MTARQRILRRRTWLCMPLDADSKPVRRPARHLQISMAWKRAPRFVRNAAISLPTFLLDLGLLFLLVQRAHMGYLAATILSFLVGNGLSYFLARWLVFSETKRGFRAG